MYGSIGRGSVPSSGYSVAHLFPLGDVSIFLVLLCCLQPKHLCHVLTQNLPLGTLRETFGVVLDFFTLSPMPWATADRYGPCHDNYRVPRRFLRADLHTLLDMDALPFDPDYQ